MTDSFWSLSFAGGRGASLAVLIDVEMLLSEMRQRSVGRKPCLLCGIARKEYSVRRPGGDSH